MTSWYIFTSME